MIKIFTKHPTSVGETYIQHLRIASRSGLRLMFAGFACLIHSIFPFLFVHTASNTVKDINQNMSTRRAREETTA